MKHIRLIIVAVLLIATGCSSPKVEKKKPSLKSDTFDTLPGGGDLVIHGAEAQRPTRLEGRVNLRAKNGPALRSAPLQLFSGDGRMLAQTNTDSKGVFLFSLVLPNGSYVIKIASPNYTGELQITVNDRDLASLFITAQTAR